VPCLLTDARRAGHRAASGLSGQQHPSATDQGARSAAPPARTAWARQWLSCLAPRSATPDTGTSRQSGMARRRAPTGTLSFATKPGGSGLRRCASDWCGKQALPRWTLLGGSLRLLSEPCPRCRAEQTQSSASTCRAALVQVLLLCFAGEMQGPSLLACRVHCMGVC